MLFEYGMLAWLQTQNRSIWRTSGVFFQETEGPMREPFLVLHPVFCGGARDIGVLHPIVQLDVCHTDKYQAMSLAETITASLFGRSFTSEGVRYEALVCERAGALRVDDGTWKVPIRISFYCQEV